MPSANILTPRPPPGTRFAATIRAIGDVFERTRAPAVFAAKWRDETLGPFIFSRVVAILVCVALLAAVPLDVPAQQAHSKKKKSSKPKPVPCRTGCAPNTSAPEITAATPEDEAAQRELSSLARALHNATPGRVRKTFRVCRRRMPATCGARARRWRSATTTTTRIARSKRWHGSRKRRATRCSATTFSTGTLRRSAC